MAKAKLTESGNVKLTLTPLQYATIRAMIYRTRLGGDNPIRDAISQLASDLEDFDYESEFVHEAKVICDMISYSYSPTDGLIIEVGVEDENRISQ